MKKPLGVLLVGGARTHQESYARDFAADPRSLLVALVEDPSRPAADLERSRALAESLRIPFLTSLEEAIALPDVAVASICVDFEKRAAAAVACARAKKHIYLDTVVATSDEEAVLLDEAVRSNGVRSQVFSFVHTAWAERARDILASGALGEPVGLHCDALFAKGRAGTADLSRPRREAHPPRRLTFFDAKRELLTTGVYAVGLIRWLTGREVTSVFCRTANYFFAEHQGRDVEDFAVLSTELTGGLTATVTAGRIGWMSDLGAGPLRILLAGSRGTRLVDAASPRLEIACDAPAWSPGDPHPQDPMGFWRSTTAASGGGKRFQWRNVEEGRPSDASRFLDAIEGGRDPAVTAADGSRTLRVLLAGYRSAAEGRPVLLASG